MNAVRKSTAGSDVLEASATSLAARLRRRELTSLSLIDAHIARIAAVNPFINALVADRYAAARDEARAADARLDEAHAAGTSAELPPFLGVPFTAKEFIRCEGLPHTAGSVHRVDIVAMADAPIVARMRAAGGVLLGVTNVPEGGLWMETYNRVYGRTSNPWDKGRTSGGSSGGEGALIAAGGSPIGIGADIGGSIRLPSAFCGIPGHKPTGGVLPTAGHWPTLGDGTDLSLTVGPMVRRTEDLLPLMRVLSDPGATFGEALAPTDLRVFVADGSAAVGVSSVVRRAVRRAGAALERQGAVIRDLGEPFLRRGLELWAATLGAAEGGESFGEMMSGDDRVRLRDQLPAALLRRSPHITPVLLVILLERLLGSVPGGALGELLERGDELRLRLERVMGADGVILCPVYPTVAPRHHAPLARPLGFAWTAVFNALHFPVTVVPVGFDSHGMPLSVQVVGPRGGDARTIAAAAAIEAVTGGWTMAEPV